MNRAYNIELQVILIEKSVDEVGIPTLCVTSCRLMAFFCN